MPHEPPTRASIARPHWTTRELAQVIFAQSRVSPEIAREDVTSANNSRYRDDSPIVNVPTVVALDDSGNKVKVTAGRNVKLARILAGGISQRQLALRLECDPRQVSEWERGEHAPTHSLDRLAEALGQDWHWFLIPHEDEWAQHGIE